MTKLAALTLTGLAIALISFTELGWAAAPGQKVLYAFKGDPDDGLFPESSLIFDTSGNLYGTTTAGGGPAEAGTVFELSPTSSGWSETVLYSFQGGTDGDYPNTNLAMDAAGNLYGTTLYGGTGAGSCTVGCGTVFELTPPTNGGPWTKSTIYSFQDAADGAFPAGVILDKFGNLYGTAGAGGDLAACSGQGCGTVFELSPGAGIWTEKTLYSFQGGTQDGGGPAGVTMDSIGNLYGATEGGGGVNSLGTIYELSPSNGNWLEKILYSFVSNTSGRNPTTPLVFNSDGYLVGTAQGGNPNGCCGVVFALVPHSGGNWIERVVFRFSTENGGPSSGTLVFDASGNLYGTSPSSGPLHKGTAYRLKRGPKGGVTQALYSFCPHTGCPDGSNPFGGLILDGSGNLYGTALGGGLGYGVVYEITP